jgi:ATP-dependent RNA helicase RhlE
VTFNEFPLDPCIHGGIEDAGYVTPTPIQEKSIPLILRGTDILGLAQTGTGKTAAFVVPILQRLLKGPRKRIRALIVAPTRELAEQIHQAVSDLGKKTGIRSVSVYGGVSKNPQIAVLKKGVEIVVACPGRLLDHLGERAIDLSNVEVLVLDEADRMCDMGFLPDIRRILKALPSERQTLFFSATMPKEIRGLADTILKNPTTVQIGMIAPAATVSHALYPVPADLKKDLLFAILDQTATGRVLIFTRTKHKAKSLATQLQKRKYRVAPLQGNMSQNRRQDSISGFRDGKYDVLVATDIAARGIDVSEVTHVINFDMPDTVDAYTHRIGRTGRALLTGDAFTLAVTDDEPILRGIEKVLGAPIERRSLSGFDYGTFVPEEQFARKSRPKPRPKPPARHNRRPPSRNRRAPAPRR